MIRVKLFEAVMAGGHSSGPGRQAPPDRSVMLAVVSRRSNRGCQPDPVRRLLGVEDRGSSPKLFFFWDHFSFSFLIYNNVQMYQKKKKRVNITRV